MSPQHDVVVEIHRIGFGERAASAEQRHDLHRMGVLDLALAGHGNAPAGKQRIAGDHRRDDVLVIARPLVIIGHRSESVPGDQPSSATDVRAAARSRNARSRGPRRTFRRTRRSSRRPAAASPRRAMSSARTFRAARNECRTRPRGASSRCTRRACRNNSGRARHAVAP